MYVRISFVLKYNIGLFVSYQFLSLYLWAISFGIFYGCLTVLMDVNNVIKIYTNTLRPKSWDVFNIIRLYHKYFFLTDAAINEVEGYMVEDEGILKSIVGDVQMLESYFGEFL